MVSERLTFKVSGQHQWKERKKTTCPESFTGTDFILTILEGQICHLCHLELVSSEGCSEWPLLRAEEPAFHCTEFSLPGRNLNRIQFSKIRILEGFRVSSLDIWGSLRKKHRLCSQTWIYMLLFPANWSPAGCFTSHDLNSLLGTSWIITLKWLNDHLQTGTYYALALQVQLDGSCTVQSVHLHRRCPTKGHLPLASWALERN